MWKRDIERGEAAPVGGQRAHPRVALESVLQVHQDRHVLRGRERGEGERRRGVAPRHVRERSDEEG